jgi:phage-related protein (TIGR01555 family)
MVGRPNPWSIPLGDHELSALYANNGMARRIVDLLPSRATRRGWTVPDVDAAEHKRLRAWERCREAMIWARLHGGAVLLMVTEDDVPAAWRRRGSDWLQQPLELERVGKLHALQVFDAAEATPQAFEESIASPNYRMPRLWSLSGPGWYGTVHASRVVHFRGARRPPSEARRSSSNVMPDASVLQHAWDEIRRLTETMQGGAVLAQELRESVLKVSGLAAKQTGDEATALQTRLSMMSRTKALLGLILVGENDEYENRGNAPTGFERAQEKALRFSGASVSGSTNQP